jgi:hypothetical protein
VVTGTGDLRAASPAPLAERLPGSSNLAAAAGAAAAGVQQQGLEGLVTVGLELPLSEAQRAEVAAAPGTGQQQQQEAPQHPSGSWQ